MAIFRTLVQTLSKVKSTLPRRRRFTVASSISLISFPTCPLSFSLSPHLAFYNSKFSLFKPLFPFHGPLFLSAQPYNLSQFSTPLYQQCDVVLRKVEAFHLLSHEQIHCKVESNNVPRNSGLTIFRVDVKKVQNDGKENFIEIFVNLPNLVSVSRMVSGPILGWMITNECYSYAFLGLAISGATDWLDGYLARKMRIDSVIGSYLDPLADKVLIGCVALAMVHKDLLHAGLVGTILLRDVFLIGGVFYKRASSLGWEWESWFDFFNIDRAHRQRVEPLYLSKVNTVLQLILVAAALLQPELGTERTQSFITYLSWLVASTTVASTVAYGAQHMRSSALSSRNR